MVFDCTTRTHDNNFTVPGILVPTVRTTTGSTACPAAHDISEHPCLLKAIFFIFYRYGPTLQEDDCIFHERNILLADKKY